MMKKWLAIVCVCLCLPAISVAGVSLSATRIVFSGKEKQTTIKVNNSSSEEGIFQAWLDKDNDPYAEIPFAVVPTFSKVSAGGAQILRIISQGKGLPQDQESVFWLNVQEIPKVSSEYAEGEASGVSFTIRQRIKLFYRPTSVTSEPIEMTENLQFSLDLADKRVLKIKNASPNFITLINFSKLGAKSDDGPLKDAVMLAPQSETNVTLKAAMSSSEVLSFESMSDYGFAIPFTVKLNAADSIKPVKVEK